MGGQRGSSHTITISALNRKQTDYLSWNVPGSPEVKRASLTAQQVKNLLQCRRHRGRSFDPWVRKIPKRRKWQPIPVFLPEKSHGQQSLVGYSPKGCKEPDRRAHAHAAANGYESACQCRAHGFDPWSRN